MNKKCNNCKHRYDVRPWCNGCENKFPGVDQFDFYQPIEHTILMVEVRGLAQASYDRVVSYEIKDGMIVLTCHDGSTASFPNDGSWRMLDFTPTYGWNKNPGVIPEMSDKRQVKITLVRQRSWEDSTWVDDIFVVMDANQFDVKGNGYWENPENVEKELRQVIQDWLQTQKGWEANVQSSLDFNWGDFVSELPIEMNDIKLSSKTEGKMAINAVVSIAVNQDEHLAPDDVPAVLIRSDGTTIGTGTVDFQSGMVHSTFLDDVMTKDELILVRPENSHEHGLVAHREEQETYYILNA